MSMRIPRYSFWVQNADGEKVNITRFVMFAEDEDKFPEFQTEDGREAIDEDINFFEIEGVRFQKGRAPSE